MFRVDVCVVPVLMVQCTLSFGAGFLLCLAGVVGCWVCVGFVRCKLLALVSLC